MAELSTTEQDMAQPHTIVCPYCRRCFSTDEDLTLHVITRHTPVRAHESTPQQAKSQH